MTTPITLPRGIPGILIPGVLVDDGDGGASRVVFTDDEDGTCTLYPYEDCYDGHPQDMQEILLSDRMSRVAAAWWVCGQGGGISEEEQVILMAAKNGLKMGPTAQTQLRDMVLRRMQA